MAVEHGVAPEVLIGCAASPCSDDLADLDAPSAHVGSPSRAHICEVVALLVVRGRLKPEMGKRVGMTSAKGAVRRRAAHFRNGGGHAQTISSRRPMRELGGLGTLHYQPDSRRIDDARFTPAPAERRCGSLDVWEGEGRAPRMCASTKRQYCESVWLLQPSHWLFCSLAQARVTPADSASGHVVAQGSPPQLSSGRSGPRAGKQTELSASRPSTRVGSIGNVIIEQGPGRISVAFPSPTDPILQPCKGLACLLACTGL